MRPSAFGEIQSEIRAVLRQEFASPTGTGETGNDETPPHPGAAKGAKVDF